MLNEDMFNDVGFNVTGNIKKLITLLVDTLFKKKNISKSFTSDLIIIYKYAEKINLKSYIKTVEDVYSNIPVGRVIISRKSELH